MRERYWKIREDTNILIGHIMLIKWSILVSKGSSCRRKSDKNDWAFNHVKKSRSQPIKLFYIQFNLSFELIRECFRIEVIEIHMMFIESCFYIYIYIYILNKELKFRFYYLNCLDIDFWAIRNDHNCCNRWNIIC